MNAIKASKRDVQHLIRATFPEYEGRKFSVVASAIVILHDLNWGGGTRSQYRAATIKGDRIASKVDLNAPPPWFNHREGARLEIPAGAIVAQHEIFCGRDLGLTFYVNPADMAKLLPAPAQRHVGNAHGL